jgi:molybdopterin-guanine dinucleotide biosynthesis protein MobB
LPSSSSLATVPSWQGRTFLPSPTFTRAGADTMLITSPAQVAMVRKNPSHREASLAETVASYCEDLDTVLTEGFKRSSMPKIEVHRRQRSAELLCRGQEHDPTLIAVAGDSPLQLDVPIYDIDDAEGLSELIVARYQR